jgi:acyl-ACP thioesterase
MPADPGKESQYIWREGFRIRSHEVDAQGKASLTALCQFMQEAASNHAHHLQFGYADLAARGLLWVLARMLIRIDHYPVWKEQIEVHTWPSGLDRLFAQRDFEILDQRGEGIAVATSDWLILDARNRRPQRTEIFFGGKIRLLPERRALEERPGRIPSIQTPEAVRSFPIRFSDLDMQGHVNHVKYIEWIVDSCPWEVHKSRRIISLEIHFLAESSQGDEVSVFTKEAAAPPPQSSLLHSIVRDREQQVVCRARTIWKSHS